MPQIRPITDLRNTNDISDASIMYFEAVEISSKDAIKAEKTWELSIELNEKKKAEKKTIYEEMMMEDIPAFLMERTKSKFCLGL